jgi:hypothetical protein
MPASMLEPARALAVAIGGPPAPGRHRDLVGDLQPEQHRHAPQAFGLMRFNRVPAVLTLQRN